MRKYIHLPTLFFHALLFLIAVLTLEDHPGIILWVGVIGLIGHIVYAARLVLSGVSPVPIILTHMFGCQAQVMAYCYPPFEPTGLGSGLAAFYYQSALIVAFILLPIVLFVAWAMRKHT